MPIRSRAIKLHGGMTGRDDGGGMMARWSGSCVRDPVSAAKAFHGRKRQAVSDTRGVQTPWFARNISIGGFPLF